MEKVNSPQKLADLIEKHPNCTFEIDNDCWYMMDGEKEITNSENCFWVTKWYDHSNLYGAGISEALLDLLNRQDKFNISAQSV